MAPRTPLEEKLVEGTLAPLITASFLACAACGVVVALAWAYFARFKRDRPAFKLLVAGLTAVAIADTVCEAHFGYDWAVYSFGDYSAFASLPWEFVAYCCLTYAWFLFSSFNFEPNSSYFDSGFGVCVVQLWYAWRVWVISERGWALSGVIAAGALAGLGCILRIAVFCAQQDTLAAFAEVRPIVLTWVIVLTVVDLLITAAVVYYIVFKPRKESGGLLNSDSRIHSIAVLTAKTNLVSLVVQVIILALLLGYPDEFHFGSPSFLECKIYVGCLIATLNSRDPQTLRSNGGTYPPWRSNPDELPSFVLPASGAETPLSGRAGVTVLELEDQRPPFDTKLSAARSAARNGTGLRTGGDSELTLPTLSWSRSALQADDDEEEGWDRKGGGKSSRA
ncbi:hypothetical protein JCM6882_006465 [Rhodosporidiobolus microsporus]